MKIRVVITIDLPDPEQWTTAYGIEGAANIRRDVKQYVGNGIQQSGAFGTGEVDADVDWS
jgi:hypothetical protein